MAHLTATMGIAAPSLYAAFGDKRALFEEAASRYAEQLDVRVRSDLSADTARAALQAVLHTAAAAFTAAGTPPGCLVMGEPLLADRRATTRAAIAARLRKGVADGELCDLDEAHEVASFTDTVLAGMEARARDGATREELDRAAHRAMQAWDR